ncbi:hypothetical protein [Ekhidna sp.]|uniref:hypothetical protein n=1 Tax=Ekhidna sp. TaxID=2608089 RepID=UPI0032F05AD6
MKKHAKRATTDDIANGLSCFLITSSELSRESTAMIMSVVLPLSSSGFFFLSVLIAFYLLFRFGSFTIFTVIYYQ